MANLIKLKQIDRVQLASFVDGQIDGSGAIYATDRAVVTDNVGNVTTSSTNSAEVGYLSGVTSAIQTQIDSKLSETLTDGSLLIGNSSNEATEVALSGDITVSNAGVVAIASGAIVNADVNTSAAIALTKLAATTVSRALVSDGSGFISPSAVTATEIGYISGVTSAIQTQLNAAMSNVLTNAFIFVGNASNVATGVVISGDISITNAGVVTISNLTTFGRSLIDDASASAARTTLELGSLAVLSAAPAGTLTGTTLASNVLASSLTSIGTLSAGAIPTTLLTGTVTNAQLAGSIAASKLVGTDIATVGTITTGVWTGTSVAVANGGTGATTASGARTNLGLVIGTDVAAQSSLANYLLLSGGILSGDLHVNARLKAFSGVNFSAIDTGWSSIHGQAENYGVKIGTGTNFGIIQVGENTTAYSLCLQPYGGSVGIGSNSIPGARFQVSVSDAGTIGQIIKAAASQTADLLQFQNNSETVIAKITKDGSIYGGGNSLVLDAGNILGSAYGLWLGVTPSETNYALITDGANTYLNAPTTGLYFRTAGITRGLLSSSLLNFSVDTTLASVTTSTSSTTGALVVSGGVGIAGALNSALGATFATTSGYVGIGTSSPGAQLQINCGADTIKGLLIKGASSQSANYLEVIDNSSVLICKIDSSANLFLGTLSVYKSIIFSSDIYDSRIISDGYTLDLRARDSGQSVQIFAAAGLTASFAVTSNHTVVYGMNSKSAAGWLGGAGIVSRNQTSDNLTFTDTSSSGVIALGCLNSMSGQAIAASNATTITNASTLYIESGVGAGANVTITNSWAIHAAGGILSEAQIKSTVTTASSSVSTGSGVFAGGVGVAGSLYAGILESIGGLGANVVTKTSNYTATSSDHTILCDATSGTVTITLPAATNSTRRIYHIKKIDSSVNTVIIDAASSEEIDGSTTQTISTQYSSFTIHCDGSAWHII